jgi:hypothetical protein
VSALDTATLLAADLEARCNAEAYFADVVVVLVAPGDTETDVRQKLATLLGKNDKRGVAILVLPVEDADDDLPEVAFGPLRLSIAFQVIEHPLLNKTASGGTGKPGRKVARRLRDLFKHYIPAGLAHCLVPEKNCITPLVLKDGLRGWEVAFTAQEADEEVLEKAATPVLTQAGNTVVITCATSGAAVYYTVDESHPWSGNAAAILYSAPVAITVEGVTLRAGAFKSGLIASDTARSSFTQS